MSDTAAKFALDNPAWLAAIAIAPLLWFYFRRGLVYLPVRRQVCSLIVRFLIVLAIAAGLAAPRLRLRSSQVFVLATYDTSRGIGLQAQEQGEAFRQELREAAGSIGFGELSFPHEAECGPGNLATAVASARAMIPADRVPRMLIMTDGNRLGEDSLAVAEGAGCAIDVVPLGPPEHEVYVAAVETSGTIRQGESFFADVVVQSLHNDMGRLILGIDEIQPLEREVTLEPGQNRFRFRGLAGPGPTVRLSAHIVGCRDTLPENNTAASIVYVLPRPRVLLVDSQPRLAEALREALEASEAFEVTLGRPESIPKRLDQLLEYDLVIVSNVPAAGLSKDQLTALHRYVHDNGGGLIVVGGNRAFTAGDYGGTPIETMLPVEAYVKPDKPKPTLAMLLVLDRSGSMQGAPIELARQAARQAVGKLGPLDQVGIIAFEDRVHWIVPLQPFTDPEQVIDRIGAITAGGGTNIAPAFDQAHLALRGAVADRKHIILLSDGISHPADFHTIARRIAEDGITVSTVGVGDEASEQFLSDIADLASGQAYFCAKPADMPSIFEADVIAAGKHGITEEPFQPAVVSPARMLAGFDPAAAPPLLGYVDTRTKPGSQLVLTSPAGDPLLAWWRYGRGVSMAFTSDVHNRWAAAWHRWQGFGPFWVKLARQAVRVDPLGRFRPAVALRGGRAMVALDAVDREGRWLNGADVRISVLGPGGRRVEPVACELIEPGRYAASVPAEVAGDYHVEFAVRSEGEPTCMIRRGFVVDYPDELRIRPANTKLLRQIAQRSGGRFAPADALRPAETSVPRTVLLWPWLFLAAIVLFVLDVRLKRVISAN